ncbi:MAG: hypothetical protein QM713_05035 [Arachnia sp.]
MLITDEFDGVRTFHVPTPRPTLHAVLRFRAGMVDETLPTSGWLHLLEHLALHDMGTATLAVQGTTELLTTTFQFDGPPEEVSEALQRLTAWFADPDLSRAEHESGVLQAEARLRRGSAAGRALGERYGAVGPGLASYDEPGLARAEQAALRELCARVFTRGNATLALYGSPPDGLRLNLPGGQLQPIPVAVETPDPRPAGYRISPGGFVLSGVIDRGHVPLSSLLARAINEVFRTMDGVAYAPWSSYEAVDRMQAVVFGGADVPDELGPQLVKSIRRATALLHDRDWTRKAIDEMRARARQEAQDERTAGVLPARAGHAYLTGQPIVASIDDMLEETLSPDAEALSRAVARFEGSLLMGVGPSVEWKQRMPMSTQPTEKLAVAGATHRARGWPMETSFLAVDVDGVSAGSDSTHVVAPFAALAGVLTYPDGARTLIKRDGWYLHVEPTLWADGQKAIAAIDATVPSSITLPMPARRADEIPSPPRLHQVMWFIVQRIWLPVVCVAGLLLVVWLILEYDINPRYAFVPLLTGAVSMIIARTREKSAS